MSFQVTEAFVTQFATNFMMLSRQMVSRLQPFVRVQPGIVGSAYAVERLGQAESYQIASRHADTQMVEMPHSRRFVDLAPFAWAELVDELDKKRMLADPTSPYLMEAVAALNRRKDSVIIAAMNAAARTNTGTASLPAGQQIAVGGTGLTLAKLRQAREILDANEVGIDDQSGQTDAPQRFMVVSAQQITNLLSDTTITSADFNTVRALVNGQINDFLGFRFIRSGRLPRVSTTRSCFAFARNAVVLGIGADIETSIDVRPDKNRALQPYARMLIGAVRAEDEAVVQVDCQET